jgi:hypothetical protein
MKKTARKLSLSSETLRNLDASKIRDAVGAYTTTSCIDSCAACTATNLCSYCRPCY